MPKTQKAPAPEPCRSEAGFEKLPLTALSDEARVRGDVRPSRMGRRRAWVLLAIHVAIFAHILHWQLKGETLAPLEPSEAMYTIANGVMNAGMILLLLTLTSTLILGRWFCGWACHLVALQDLSAWLLKRVGLRPRPLRSRWLMWVPLLGGLHLFLFPLVARWIMGAPRPEFTMGLTKSEFWETFPGFWLGAITFLFTGFAMVWVLGSKGFCTYACPYGGLFGVADRLAPGRIRVTDACKGCGHCTAVCTSNVLVHREVHEYGAVIDPGCMKCLDCVSTCPEEALYFGFGAPAIATSPRIARPKKATQAYSPAEGAAMFAVFALTLLVLRGLPVEIIVAIRRIVPGFTGIGDGSLHGGTPLLLSLGVASTTAFLVIHALRLLRRTTEVFQRWTLKDHGRLTRAGWIFTTLCVAWFGFLLHGAWTQVLLWRAADLRDLTSPIAAGVRRHDPGVWDNAPTAIRDAVEEGVALVARVRASSPFPDPRLGRLAAWFSLCQGRTEDALAEIEASQRETPDARWLWREKGHILLATGRGDEALTAFSEGSHDTAPETWRRAFQDLGQDQDERNQRRLLEAWAAREALPWDLGLNLVAGLVADGSVDRARQHLDAVIEARPTPESGAPFLLAARALMAETGSIFVENLKSAVSKTPEDFRLHLLWWDAARSAGDGATARAIADGMVSRWPKDAAPLAILGETLQSLGDTAGALRAFQEAHRRAPDRYKDPAR